MDDLQFMLLFLAVFGNVCDTAARQEELHLWSLVFGGLVALRERERHIREAVYLINIFL